MRSLFKMIVLLSLSALLALSACGSTSTSGKSSSSGDTIKIGMVADISGKVALSGKFKKNGADLAVKEINANGGIMGKKLQLVVEDGQSTQQGNVAAFQKLSSDKGIVAIIGSIRSTNCKAMNPYAKKAGIPVAIGGTNVTLTTTLNNPWYFRFRPNDSYAAKSIADYTASKGDKKVAIVYDTDAFGSGGKDLLLKDYKKDSSVDVVAVEGYNSGTKDFSPFLEKIKASGATAINTYMTNSEDAGQMMKQLREKGMKLDVIGSASLAQETTLKIAGKALDGVYSVNDFALDQSAKTKSYVEKYKAKYGELPDVYTAWAYDALHIFANVINEKKSTKPADIQKGLHEIKDYTGAEGTYNFDKNGDGLHKYTIVTVKNGKIVTVK